MLDWEPQENSTLSADNEEGSRYVIGHDTRGGKWHAFWNGRLGCEGTLQECIAACEKHAAPFELPSPEEAEAMRLRELNEAFKPKGTDHD